MSRRRPCSYRIGSLLCPPSPICTPRFLCADFPSPCIPQATVSVLDGLGCARSSIRSVTFSDSGMHLTFCLDVVLIVRGIADPGFACFGSHYTRIPFTSPSWALTNVVQSSLRNSSACPWVQDHRCDRSLLRSPVLPNRFIREAWQESFVASPRGRCSLRPRDPMGSWIPIELEDLGFGPSLVRFLSHSDPAAHILCQVSQRSQSCSREFNCMLSGVL